MKTKAAVLHGLKDVRLEEVELPALAPGEVMVRVKAALTCGTDRKMYLRGHPKFQPPFIFGHEFTGEVVEVGAGVTQFRPGMRVAAANSAPCNQCYWCKVGNQSMCENMFLRLSGAFAEYAIIPAPIVAQNTVEIPAHVTYRQAALLEPLACVVHGVERSGIRLGDTVVVLGAGPIGLFFNRLVHLKGARVIAADMKAERLAVAKQLGAHETLDLSKVSDPVAAIRERTEGGRGVDVAIEAVGLPEVWQTAIATVRKGGIANLFGGCASNTKITVDTGLIHYNEVTIKGVFHFTPEYVRRAMNLIAQGSVNTDIFITHEFPLSRISEAIELLVNQVGIKISIKPD
ncbi:MAG: alcohol dehydrogenase catalytic domain-containing protein [Verrucomicrobiia bacterium]